MLNTDGKLAIAWPLGRTFVTSVIIGVKNVNQLKENLEPADWDLSMNVCGELEARTRPEEEYITWYARFNNARFFNATELHHAGAEPM
jgi:diketogulonate reductase-like aldo/keto reductase